MGSIEATLKEFSLLTPRDQFAERLTKLKDDAAHEQAQLKKAILTRTAQAQISDLQAMIDRYLDDETYKAYADALERAKGELAALEKAKAKKAAAHQLAVQRAAPKGAPPAKTAPAQSKAQPAPAKPAAPPGKQESLPF